MHGLLRASIVALGVMTSIQSTADEPPLYTNEDLERLPTHPSFGGPPVDRPAPGFAVRTLDGKLVALDELRGNVVVLNFWHRACGPCIWEMPQLNRLVRECADRPVVFLAPALDSDDALRELLRSREFLYRVVPDSEEMNRSFGIQAFPTHVLIDRQGVVRHVLPGGHASIGKTLGALIDRLLRQ
jgi:peroxiredoxin